MATALNVRLCKEQQKLRVAQERTEFEAFGVSSKRIEILIRQVKVEERSLLIRSEMLNVHNDRISAETAFDPECAGVLPFTRPAGENHLPVGVLLRLYDDFVDSGLIDLCSFIESVDDQRAILNCCPVTEYACPDGLNTHQAAKLFQQVCLAGTGLCQNNENSSELQRLGFREIFFANSKSAINVKIDHRLIVAGCGAVLHFTGQMIHCLT